MNESKLSELLEQAGERTAVNPPPIDAMRSGATRRRRRRTAVWSAAGTAVAVAAVIGGSTALTNNGASPLEQPPVAGGTPTATVPDNVRLVGVGHTAVAVPKDWATNQLKCGTPTKNTVIVDPGAQGYCLPPYPAGVESVQIGSKPASEFKADETFEVEGVQAQRQRTVCVKRNKVPVCTGAVLIPSRNIWIQAESSTGEAEVGKALEQIWFVQDATGVPGFQTLELETSQAKYLAALKDYGLVPTIVSKPAPGVPKGAVTAVSPTPGTMVPNGSTVTVTVVG
ncbi:PASTA domain-containing protein [Kribbella sp. NPDC056951]|uniref:PASTA domain-containing protein n=1 Tax=Kribbella sp. NPDC056951 TaxID=3345978 RepID=UPI00363D3B1A